MAKLIASWRFITIHIGEKGLQGEMGNKGVTGLDGKQGPPGNNAECILGKESENLIGMQVIIIT